ncbi:MAG: LEA type 2 family protein [Magnetococcales bacterium]|nr:LEA type 2 family protein [Magnetococcales bacterium]NGZ04844.1 LEA type 2 family protein [Magnetococcales bacterium]
MVHAYRRPGWAWLLMGVVGLLLSGCVGLTDWTGPKLEHPRLSLLEIHQSEKKNSKWAPRFRVRLRVDNPNTIEVPIGGIECRLELQGMSFATGQSSEFFTIPAKGSAEFDVEVSTELMKAMKQLSVLLRKGEAVVDYRLVGKIFVELPFLGAVPFDKSGTLHKPLKWED